jgi:hypothetical protein
MRATGGGQRAPSRQHLHRAARPIPQPGEPDQPGATVVRGTKRGSPLPGQQITLTIRPAGLPALRLTGNLRDPPGIQPTQQLPGCRRHHGPLYTIRNWNLSQSNRPGSLDKHNAPPRPVTTAPIRATACSSHTSIRNLGAG